MQVDTTAEQILDAKVDRIVLRIKRFFLTLFVGVLVTAAVVLVLEVKREYSIDLIHGVNFKLDDWYFDNVAGK